MLGKITRKCEDDTIRTFLGRQPDRKISRDKSQKWWLDVVEEVRTARVMEGCDDGGED